MMFVTFEGLDGSGKTTQANLFADWLRSCKWRVTSVREPGGTPLGEKLRTYILHEPMDDMTVLLLFNAARRELVVNVILPDLAEGKCVVCDRFYDSTVAYQHYGKGIDISRIEKLHSMAAVSILPDITFIIGMSPLVALQRRQRAEGTLNHYDKMEAAFYERVHRGYLEIAAKDVKRCIVIDGDDTPENVAQQVKQAFCLHTGLQLLWEDKPNE